MYINYIKYIEWST